MATFGRTTTTASGGNSSGDYKYAAKATLSENGIAVSMSFYLEGGAGTEAFRGGIYGPDSTLDENTPLVAYTSDSSVTGSSAVAWRTVALTTPKDLAAGDYHLVLHTDGQMVVHRDTTGGTHALAADVFSGGLESTFGTIDADGTNDYCFYVTYHVMRGGLFPRQGVRVASVNAKSIQRIMQ